MLSTPPLVQAQLSEALSIVCGHDFPQQWPNLLSELVERLVGSNDLKTISGVLATANSIFKRYRYEAVGGTRVWAVQGRGRYMGRSSPPTKIHDQDPLGQLHPPLLPHLPRFFFNHGRPFSPSVRPPLCFPCTLFDCPLMNAVLCPYDCSNQYGSDTMVKELEGSQNVFAGPLLDTTKKLSQVSLHTSEHLFTPSHDSCLPLI